MEIHVGLADTLKLAAKFACHRIEQYRLGTKQYEVIETKLGKVKGVKRRTIYADYFYAFEGIPFAKPPLGELRFRAPQPPEKWDDVLDCTDYRSKPMQKHFIFGIIEGSEDCLYLNVYVKKLKSEKPLPVLVFIYGGGFQIGEATRDIYAPDYFMMKDVILVCISYRLGALGFLSLKDPDVGVPGNAGLKDQVMALHWIKSNIAHFNGDPNNITLFGISAGSASTHFMMATARTKGLFHKAIMQSGSAYCMWALPSQRDWPYRLACALGYNGVNNDKAIHRFLMKADAKKIAALDNSILSEKDSRDRLIIAFGPTIEAYESEDGIMTRPLPELIKISWSNEIPLILGFTSFEGLFLYQLVKAHPYLINDLGDFKDVILADIKTQWNEMKVKEIGKKLRKTFFNDEQPNIMKHFLPYLELMSHYYVLHGTQRAIHARLHYASDVPTYLYRFDFDSPTFNHYRILKCGKRTRGVSHGDDYSYLFYHASASALPKHSKEFKRIQSMIDLWTSFAANSKPSCAEIKAIDWEPVKDAKQLKCLNISDKIEVTTLPEQAKLDLFDSFYAEGTLY